MERTKASLVIDNCDLDNEMIDLRRENQHIEYQLKKCQVTPKMFSKAEKIYKKLKRKLENLMSTYESKKDSIIEQPISALSRARSNNPRKKRKLKNSMKRSIRDERIRDGNRKVIS